MKKLENYVLREKKINEIEREILVLLEEIVQDYDDFYLSNVDVANLIHFGKMIRVKRLWAAISSLGCSVGSYFASLELLDKNFQAVPFVLETISTSFLGYFLLDHINNDEVLLEDPDFIVNKCKSVNENYTALLSDFFSRYAEYASSNYADFNNVDEEISYLFVKHKDFVDAKIKDGTFSEDFNFDSVMDIYYECGFHSFNDIINNSSEKVKILKKDV
ncbi:MAG: hypothetical protein Q4C29_00765 [bacterium]|nr:hypothetical protein [bacterium]